jgi:LAGLIDADG endonuclease
MCSTCEAFENRFAAGTLDDFNGPVTQSGRVSPWHGERRGFKSRQVHSPWSSFTLGGFVSGEGCFFVTRKKPPFKDGTERKRFVFQVAVAERDCAVLEELRSFLGFGSIRRAPPDKPHHQVQAIYCVASIRAHLTATIPFAEEFLLFGAKRRQFEKWREELLAWERDRPSRYGKGPSACSVEDCDKPVRGRGLCRSHYYRATGY